MKKILFVCTGNICRSPMAEAIFNQMRAQRGLPPAAESAGLMAVNGDRASPHAVKALAEVGIDLRRHRARPLTRALLEEFDEVFVMTASHRESIERVLPQYLSKVRVLGSGIEDPYGQSLPVYRKCRDELLAALRALPAEYFEP